MGYIEQLRQQIGHAPILMVGAALLIVDEQDRLLLMKRSDSGCWGLSGGTTEPGEVVEDAARCEAFEETGLQVENLALFGVFSGPELYYKYPNGDEVYNVMIVYLSRDVSGDVYINGEHTEWCWFGEAEIPNKLSPPIRPVIEKFTESVRP